MVFPGRILVPFGLRVEDWGRLIRGLWAYASGLGSTHSNRQRILRADRFQNPGRHAELEAPSSSVHEFLRA